MTSPAFPARGFRHPLSVTKALHRAWFWWILLLAIPFLFLQWVIWTFATGKVNHAASNSGEWFLAAMVYLLAFAPGAFFLRARLFKDYWKGHPVQPRRYVMATIIVGLALAIGGVFSLVGCIKTGSLMPNLLPALLALVLFALHWPTGRAMVKTTGREQDAQLYEEPS
jgi:hypothetical protein